MKKIEYSSPVTSVITLETAQMIAYSGGDTQNSVIVSGDEDNSSSDVTNRSRYHDCWEDEEEEDNF